MIEFDRLTRPDIEPRGALIRDLILAIGCGTMSLAAALDRAWRAGYEAKVEDEADYVRRDDPGPEVLARARHVIRQHPDRQIAARAAGGWRWAADIAGWTVDGDDCTIRPSIDGTAIIIMEAGGEYSGEIMVDENGKTPFRFPDATFR